MHFFSSLSISPLEKGLDLHIKMNPMLCAKFGWKCFSGSGEDFKKFSIMYFYYVAIISTFRRACPFIWEKKLESLHPRMLCAKFGWKWPRSEFLKFWMYFYYFTIISPWRRAWPFIWTNLNSLHLSMFCAKIGWNWPSGSWEDFLKGINLLLLFLN